MESESMQEESFDAIIEAVETNLQGALSQKTGSLYIKSRDVAAELDYTPKQVGAALAQLRESETELTVEQWAYSGGTTWRISRDR